MEKRKKFILPENEIPHQWYNVAAEMKNKPQPYINPATKEPIGAKDFYPLFSEELSRQEVNQMLGLISQSQCANNTKYIAQLLLCVLMV